MFAQARNNGIFVRIFLICGLFHALGGRRNILCKSTGKHHAEDKHPCKDHFYGFHTVSPLL